MSPAWKTRLLLTNLLYLKKKNVFVFPYKIYLNPSLYVSRPLFWLGVFLSELCTFRASVASVRVGAVSKQLLLPLTLNQGDIMHGKTRVWEQLNLTQLKWQIKLTEPLHCESSPFLSPLPPPSGWSTHLWTRDQQYTGCLHQTRMANQTGAAHFRHLC